MFPSSEGVFYSNFYGVGMGVALAWDAIEDITTRVDLNKVGITQEEFGSHGGSVEHVCR